MEVKLGLLLSSWEELTTSDHASVVSMSLFVALLCGCIVVGHLLEENRWMNESITALIIGVVTGVLILLSSGGKSSHLLVFSEDLFFIYLLPPIIFNAGFQVKKKQFFRNFITIMLFGAVGTLICCVIISFGVMQIFGKWDIGIGSFDIGDYLAIGAIFAATDSVCTLQVLNQDETPLLYSLVFGEGVVNDATSVVLFNAIRNFDLTKIDARIALQFSGNFLQLFLTSTLLGVLTGLLSAYIIKKLYIGSPGTSVAFTRKSHTQLQGDAIMITSTITVVLVSTVVFGLMTKPLIRLLLPMPRRTGSNVSSDQSSPKSATAPLLGSGQDSDFGYFGNFNSETIPPATQLRLLLTIPTSTVHHYWRKFDDTFMRPVFGGRGFVPHGPQSPAGENDP
ncbi:Cation/H+ exchanger [Dillenia turbinata]|uniref:Cation/H+ exchanger n=1 Tax=Dillenia turbinata TaxID=194707 RepID=A0AAN8YVR2_9MAGN